jgi:NitT/TauT family transport system substrate-binding protein
MNRSRNFLAFALAIALAVVSFPGFALQAMAATPGAKTFTLAVSNYTGWMPWYYADDAGILRKWADKYGISIVLKPMDYGDSLDAYAQGKADAVVITNMEALDLAASKSVDTSVVVMGDYSNGNDAVLTRRLKLDEIKGEDVLLEKGTVSQYLLARALAKAQLKDTDVNMVDESDAKIESRFLGDAQAKVVVTWNPMVMGIQKTVGIKKVFDSSQIPGEIQDLLVVNTAVLKDNPDLGRALTGAWYEVMDTLAQHGTAADEVLGKMAAIAGVPVAEFKGQMRTTALFLTPAAATSYVRSQELKDKTDLVRNFCFASGLLGAGAKSVDAVGIAYPDGTVSGDKANIKFRYVSTFMEEAQAARP